MTSRAALVELLGPAGAGKSTVLEALRARDERILGAPRLGGTRHTGRLAWHLAATTAAAARNGALDRRWSRDALLMAASVRALPAVVGRREQPPVTAYVFDQGPLFTLTRPALLDERMQRWRTTSLHTWRSLLDVAVWLDAPAGVLSRRIDARTKHHRLKGAGDVAAALDADRRVLADMLDVLETPDDGPVVLRFDTSARTPEEIAAEVLATIRAL